MAVLLTNPRKEVFTFTLYHSVYCAGGSPCECAKDSILRPMAGGLRYDDVINPIGVFLEAGETREFHDAVLSIQQVASAVAAGRLTKSVQVVSPVSSQVLDKVQVPKKEKVQKA